MLPRPHLGVNPRYRSRVFPLEAAWTSLSGERYELAKCSGCAALYSILTSEDTSRTVPE